MFMTNQQATELSEPSIGPLHDPTASITPQLASIFIAPGFVVFAVVHDQFNASLVQAAAQRIGVVSCVGNLPAPAFVAGGLAVAGRGLGRAWLPQA